MEYTLEELLPIVEELTSKYTSNESTSITYEVANMLMEAIVYCIEELSKSENTVLANEKLAAKTAYTLGYDLVINKVHKAKLIYNDLIENFYDYRCRNLKDTIMKGMPEFFLRYDPRFNPMDHLLTLDYPTLGAVNALKGIDVIYQYLINMKIECEFLNAFPQESIEGLLEQKVPDYEEFYYDNISYDVLLTSIACMIAQKPVKLLALVLEDIKSIEEFFVGLNKQEAELKIKMLINSLIDRGIKGDDAMKDYFYTMAGELAIRVLHGITNHSLLAVFGLSNIGVID